VARVDVDKASDLAKKFQVTAMPTLYLIAETINNHVEKVIGANLAKI
jgi:thioredoxin-like negative regulator of GroEL